jgi:hypothetical protein
MRVRGAVAELADALDLGSSSFGSAGSIPVSPTRFRSFLQLPAAANVKWDSKKRRLVWASSPQEAIVGCLLVQDAISRALVIDPTVVCKYIYPVIDVFFGR